MFRCSKDLKLLCTNYSLYYIGKTLAHKRLHIWSNQGWPTPVVPTEVYVFQLNQVILWVGI